MVTIDNSRLPITYISKTTITPYNSSNEVHLWDVNHVLSMKENFMFVAQLISSYYYDLFGLHDVKV
jgi:hypothetical protein